MPTASRTPAQTAPESAVKARLCAQLIAATAVLAGEAPDDFRRRILARPAFVYAHEYLRWARQAKNTLKARPKTCQAVKKPEPLLSRFAHHDYGPYEEVRHRIAAHRQPFGEAQGDEHLAETAWLDISGATVRKLAVDARAIWNELAGLPRLERFPPMSDELHASIAKVGFDVVPPGLLPGTVRSTRREPTLCRYAKALRSASASATSSTPCGRSRF